MKHKKRNILLITAVLALSSFLAVHFHKQEKTDSSTITTSNHTIVEKVTAVGNILPAQVIEVKSPISGTAEMIYHDEGDYVTKGTALIKVKPQPTPQDFASAKQQVAMDAVSEKKAADDLKRFTFLLKENAISIHDRDYAEAQQAYHNAELNLGLDREKLSLMAKGNAHAENNDETIANVITAPIDGYVLNRAIDLGGAVAGQSDAQVGSTLFTIADMQHLIFKGQISEIDAAKIHKGMEASITIAALPKTNLIGTLSNIALQSVQQSKSSVTATDSASGASPFNVGFNITIDNIKVPNGIKLLSGYSATADIILQKIENTLSLPESALQFENDQTFVYLPGSGKELKKQSVQVGLSDGMQVQILKGLALGETVVIPNSTTDTH